MKKVDEDKPKFNRNRIKKAFAKAKKEGAIVGGQLVDESKSIN